MLIAEEAQTERVEPADGVTGRIRKHLKETVKVTNAKIAAVESNLTEQHEKVAAEMTEQHEKVAAEMGELKEMMANQEKLMTKLLARTHA